MGYCRRQTQHPKFTPDQGTGKIITIQDYPKSVETVCVPIKREGDIGYKEFNATFSSKVALGPSAEHFNKSIILEQRMR